MDHQSLFSSSFEQGSDSRPFPEQNEEYEIDITDPTMESQGGAVMYRDHSNESNYSTYSQSNNSSPNTISYGTSSPALDYDPNFTAYSNRDVVNSLYDNRHTSARQRLEQNEDIRHTPDSLGWLPGTELLKLYEFKVPKGKQPYLELSPRWDVTFDTPRIVYLTIG